MGIKRCRLERYQQIRLVEMFVAQVTARTAADLVGVIGSVEILQNGSILPSLQDVCGINTID